MTEMCTECGTEIRLRVTSLVQHDAPPGGWSEYHTAKIVVACECTSEEPKSGQERIDIRGKIPEQWKP